MVVPTNPPIFHITHVGNLPGIINAGRLWCDAQRLARQVGSTNIGHRHIKERRMRRPVQAGAGGNLGDYVPFNFCPRSVMLYACRNGHGDYEGDQESIVHLVSNVDTAIASGQPWAFTDRHADVAHALYFDQLSQLSEVPWQVMGQKYWQDVKEERQAEFLVHDHLPWTAVVEIAAMTQTTADQVRAHLASATHQPVVNVRPGWYYL